MTIFRKLKRLRVRLYVDGELLDYTNEESLTQAEQASLNSVAEVRRGHKRVRKALRVKNRNGRYTSRPPFGLRMKPLVGTDGRELPPGVAQFDEKGRVIRSGELDRDPETFLLDANLRARRRWGASPEHRPLAHSGGRAQQVR